jgi:hypothetical protein
MTKAISLTCFLVMCLVTVQCAVLLAFGPSERLHPATRTYLQFSGDGAYVEIPSARDLSLSRTGTTVSAWLKPDTLEFRRSEGSGYVYWMGKGESGRYEWATRMYNYTNKEKPPRPNRISFYLFNAEGGLGQGSYVQEPVRPGEWIQITA